MERRSSMWVNRRWTIARNNITFRNIKMSRRVSLPTEMIRRTVHVVIRRGTWGELPHNSIMWQCFCTAYLQEFVTMLKQQKHNCSRQVTWVEIRKPVHCFRTCYWLARTMLMPFINLLIDLSIYNAFRSRKTEITAVGNLSRWPRGTLYPQKLAVTSLTGSDLSVGIVRSRTQPMEFSLVSFYLKCI
jgi:hypothetical protein